MHWWKGKTVQSLWLAVLKKLSINLPYITAILVTGIYPREIKICPHENLYMNAYSGTVHHSQKMDTSNCSIS